MDGLRCFIRHELLYTIINNRQRVSKHICMYGTLNISNNSITSSENDDDNNSNSNINMILATALHWPPSIWKCFGQYFGMTIDKTGAYREKCEQVMCYRFSGHCFSFSCPLACLPTSLLAAVCAHFFSLCARVHAFWFYVCEMIIATWFVYHRQGFNIMKYTAVFNPMESKIWGASG